MREEILAEEESKHSGQDHGNGSVCYDCNHSGRSEREGESNQEPVVKEKSDMFRKSNVE